MAIKNHTNFWSLSLAAFAVLALAPSAYGWGPGTHIHLGKLVLEQWPLLPPLVAAVLRRWPLAYLYGCIATDVVFAKRLSRIKLICHQWSTGQRILERAESDEERAFAYGYLSHLAADTVAHGQYVPRHVLLTNWPVETGHFYWELRAEDFVPSHNWAVLGEIMEQDRRGFHRLIRSELTGTFLPFPMNRILFERINRLILVGGRGGRISRLRDWVGSPLPRGLILRYHEASVERTLDLLRHGSTSAVLLEDPNGTWQLAMARAFRRQTRTQGREERRQLAHAVL